MSEAPDAIMLFAAGLGTRMRPLTETMPKPLVEVAGRSMLDHALTLVRDAGVGRVVANTHYLADQMQDALTQRDVIAVHEEKLLDTGGGLRNAAPMLGGGSVLTLNTDSVWTGPNPITRLRQAWRPEDMDALLMVVPRAMAVGHTGPGDFDLSVKGVLRRGTGLIYSGLQILKVELLHRIPDEVFSLNAVWDEIAQSDRLFGLKHQGGWCDVGRPDSIALAEDMLRAAHV